MKLSPLQLVHYLMPEVGCAANENYDPKRPADLSDDSFKAESRIHSLTSKNPKEYTSWSVELDLSQQPDSKANVPYHFHFKLVGLFHCSAQPGNVSQEVFVRTNGSSILYGIARETLRALTATGPWGGSLLPTVSFYAEEPATLAQASAKRLKSAKLRSNLAQQQNPESKMITVTLNEAEREILYRQEPSKKNDGGWQRLLGTLQELTNEQTGEISLPAIIMARISHYAFDYKKGGWQDQLTGIFQRTLGPRLDGSL